MSKQFTLGKSERLKSRKAIEKLFKSGKRFSVSPFRVYYSINNKCSLQFGTGASTKFFKKAVDRNRIKRLIREAYRLQKIPLQAELTKINKGLDLFIIYTDKTIPEYHLVYAQVEKVVKKLFAIILEDNS